jgi:hypothetical protein
MSERKTEFVPVRMTAGEVAALRCIADERSCSVGAVVRWAVRKAAMPDPPSPRNESKEAPMIAQTGGASFGIQS